MSERPKILAMPITDVFTEDYIRVLSSMDEKFVPTGVALFVAYLDVNKMEQGVVLDFAYNDHLLQDDIDESKESQILGMIPYPGMIRQVVEEMADFS